MKTNEIEIMKSVSVEIDPDTILVATYQYHTEPLVDENGQTVYGPTGNAKSDRSKSYYCWKAKIWNKADLKAEIAALKSDARRLDPWMWLPTDRFVTLYDRDSTNGGHANWLSNKLKKAKPWEEGLEILKGFKKRTPKNPEPRYNKAAAFDLDGYTAEDGSTVDISDRDSLLRFVGQTLVKEIPLKSASAASRPAQEAVAA